MISIPRMRRGWGLLCVCLGFTVPGIAVADETRQVPQEVRDKWVDNPYEPHVTFGPNLRVGSAVGWLVHDEKTYTALGGAISIGPRIGRLALEAGYVFAGLSEPGPSTLAHGNLHRFSINSRADLIRLGSSTIGPNSMLAIYGEVGVARQLHRWFTPGLNTAARIIPVDSGRTIGVIGFGLNLDHRLEQPLGFPSRIGWQLGWQLTSSGEHAPGNTVVCRGPTCVAGPTMAPRPNRDTSLLVTSTIAFTW